MDKAEKILALLAVLLIGFAVTGAIVDSRYGGNTTDQTISGARTFSGTNTLSGATTVSGAATFSSTVGKTVTTSTVDGATTFAVVSDVHILACTGAETINTITGGVAGQLLIIENTDSDCTIADDDAATAANAIDLVGTATNDVGAAKKLLVLYYNGTDWWEVAESDN